VSNWVTGVEMKAAGMPIGVEVELRKEFTEI
jgi:hypothetical protein